MKKGLILAGLVMLMAGCAGKKDNPKPIIPPTPPPAPGVATLSAPVQNEVCLTGAVVSATESNVSFTWNASINTDSYDLVIKNLLTAAITTTNTTQTQLTATLLRNTPFSWWIVSKSKKTADTSQSDTWKFYNAGAGVTTYAPFPAQIIAPASDHTVSTTTGNITLVWQGNSVNKGSISGYDVYLGTSTNPPLFQSGLTDTTLSVPVKSGNTYYWNVVTKDVFGNSSDSGPASFTVN